TATITTTTSPARRDRRCGTADQRRERCERSRSSPEALLGLRVADSASVLQVFDALAQRQHHLGIAQHIQRLDDALVELPRHDGEHRATAAGDGHRALRHPCEPLRQVRESPARLGDRELRHRLPLPEYHWTNIIGPWRL